MVETFNKNNEYKIIDIKIPVGRTIKALTPKQAEKFFNAFIEMMPERIKYLQDYINKTDSDIKLDYTKESLVDLWNWYIDKIEVMDLSSADTKKKIIEYPDYYKNESYPIKYSLTTYAIMVDIYIYLCEMLRKTDDAYIWRVKTNLKRYINYNLPELMNEKGVWISPFGWRIPFIINSVLQEKNPRRLLEEFEFYENNVAETNKNIEKIRKEKKLHK